MLHNGILFTLPLSIQNVTDKDTGVYTYEIQDNSSKKRVQS